MTANVTELVTFSNFRENEAQEAARRVVAKQDGLLSFYYGSHIEDVTGGYWVLEWETLEHHLKFTKTDAYKPFIESAKDWADVKAVIHVPLQAHTQPKVFEAPITEFMTATLKPGADREKFESVLKTLHEGVKVTKGAHASISGKTIENEDQYIFACGWDSLEAHMEAVAPEYAQGMVKQLLEVVDASAKHAKLVKYELGTVAVQEAA